MRSHQPDTQHGEQLVKVDRFCNVIGRSRFDALGAIPFHRLGCHGNNGQRAELRDLADGPHGFVAVHLRHHDVHQDAVNARRVAQHLDPRAAILRVNDFQPMLFEYGGERKNVAHVVVHHQDALSGKPGVCAANGTEDVPLRIGEIHLGAMEEKYSLLKQTL